MLLTSIRLAIRGLQRNTLRTILTMLGMIIGVAAVMTMVALGNGAQQTVEQDVRSAGTSVVHVNAGNYTRVGEGRVFSRAEVAARRAVAVIGRTTRDQVFGPGAKAVGQTVTIHGVTFTIVGITDTTDPDQMEMAFVPYTALQDALG